MGILFWRKPEVEAEQPRLSSSNFSFTSQINISDNIFLWDNKQILVEYQQENAPRYPRLSGMLAPSTSTVLPSYSTGRILSQYKTTPPTPELLNAFVNYDPSSTNPDQSVPTHILVGEWVNNFGGVDATSAETITQTLTRVDIIPLYIGVTLYEYPIVVNNEQGVLNALESILDFEVITPIVWNGLQSRLITVQGKIGSSGGGITSLSSPNGTISVTGTSTSKLIDLAPQGATNGQVLTWNGSKFAPQTPASGGISNVTSSDSSVGVTVVNNVADLSIVGKAVQGIRNNAGTLRTGNLSLIPGTNVTITDDSSGNFTINSTGGGGGGLSAVNSPDNTISVTTANNTASISIANKAVLGMKNNTTGTLRTGNVALIPGSNINITDDSNGNFTINATGGASGVTNITSTDNSVGVTLTNEVANLTIVGKAVQGVTVSGGSTTTGTINFVAGNNVTISQSGQTITINATGGGGGYASSFSTNVTTGEVPLVVNCTDTTQTTSGQTPTGWSWSVIGGSPSNYTISSPTAQNPTITFNESSAGHTYQIRLLATGSVTFTPALVTITPQQVPLVNGDFTLVTTPKGRFFANYTATDTITAVVGLTNAQTCVSVTSAVVVASNESAVPTIAITPANINGGATVNSSAIPQPTFPVSYTTTVVAEMNDSDGSTSSVSHSDTASYYLPAFVQQTNSTTAPTFTTSTTQLASSNYADGQGGTLTPSTSGVQVLWVAIPTALITNPLPKLWVYSNPFWSFENVDGQSSITIGGVSFTLLQYNLSAAGPVYTATYRIQINQPTGV